MPTTPKPYFFLLGGKDLEMKEIKNLLIANHYQEGTDFIDKNLQWGATISHFKTNFHPTQIIPRHEFRMNGIIINPYDTTDMNSIGMALL